MFCKVDGCERKADYKAQQVCQKHYFRMMRNGDYELKGRKYRRTHSSGYQILYMPGHPLASENGSVYEHRKVIHDIYGDSLPDCELCGKPCSWEPYTTHIDHINKDKSDNRKSNLRVLCNACNSGRDRDWEKGRSLIEIFGEKRTAAGWARHPDANHSIGSILRRYRIGMSGYEAVFGENKTHPKKG